MNFSRANRAFKMRRALALGSKGASKEDASVRLESFDQCWKELCSNLRPMPKMYSWSAAGRATGSFGVSEVTQGGVTVKTSKGLRFVPRKDFEMIFPFWPDYRNHKIQRHKLSFCVNSTYVVSILHWLELQ